MTTTLTTELRFLKLERRVERIEHTLSLAPIEPETSVVAQQEAQEERARLERPAAPWPVEAVETLKPQPAAIIFDERGFPLDMPPAEQVARIVRPPPLPSRRLPYATKQVRPKSTNPPSRQLE